MRYFPLLFVATSLALTVSSRADEIFFQIGKQFNARIFVDDVDKSSGQGFGGAANVKFLHSTLRPDGIIKAYNYVEFQHGPLSADNAILLPLGKSVEIPLAGEPRLTTLSLLYTSFRYEDAGAGAGKVTVIYADGGTQEFVWADPGKSGVRNTNFSESGVVVAGYFDQYHVRDDRRTASSRVYNRVLKGLDPKRVVARVVVDTTGFTDPGADAEWAIFALTGNGKLGVETSNARVNPGTRPYEMVWSNRTADEYPALVDLQDVSDWKVGGAGAVSYFASSTERPLFDPKSARLEINSSTRGAVTLRPPAPIDLPSDFNAVSLWIHGDGMNVSPDWSPATRLNVKALFRSAVGKPVEVAFITVRHGEWFQAHHQFTAEELETLGQDAKFVGFDVTGYGENEARVIYLASFSVFKDPFQSLTFQAQPQRGISLLPGATAGVNTGSGKLPFPTRETTILPINFSSVFKNATALTGEPSWWQRLLSRLQGKEPSAERNLQAEFVYEGEDATIRYTYTPARGDFEDIQGTITYPDGKTVAFTPCVDGGLRFGEENQIASAAKLIWMDLDQDVVSAKWELTVGGDVVPVTYRLRIWQKSLVLDVLCEGGKASRVLYGRMTGLEDPRLVTTPYYTYSVYSKDRPAVVVSGTETHPLFFAGNTDWYLSNGSEPFALNSVSADGVTSNGGINYRPMTNGLRQNCAERLFLTVSPIYDEVLPTIPNPASPYRKVGYNAMWRSYASPPTRDQHARYFYKNWRQGIKEQIVTDHETLFRDYEESFTFRTKTAPLKGGDEGAKWISDYLRNTLGYVYGPYSQFTDIGTTNEYYKIDHILRTPENQLQNAWFRMYAPKPVWAAEVAPAISQELKDKFGYTNSYCDVHTAIAPWQLVDYDARVPGAATFAQTFYSYGEIFTKLKAIWDGPVYSEGNFHSFYAGLTDGDYAQDKGYKLAFNPWLVNFDLRNMHDLNANFGMGCMYMFMWESGFDYKKDKAAGSFALDRIIAATLAYGHAAIMPASAGLNISAQRTHFMAVPITRLYGLSPVESIEYFDEAGKGQTTSAALINGSYVNSQLRVRYKNGTTVISNGAPTDRWLKTESDGQSLELPQNGYTAWSADGKTRVINSLDEYGNRFDYAVTPEHIYIDGRGSLVRRELAASNGPAVLRILGNGEFEYIPFNEEFTNDYLRRGEPVMAGFAITAESVTALDFENQPMPNPVEVLVSRGLSWVMPVPGAFSYLIKGTPTSPVGKLTSDSPVIFPGETVSIRGNDGGEWSLKIPSIAETNRQIWRQFDGQWLDFLILEPFQLPFRIDGQKLLVDVKSLFAKSTEVVLDANGQKLTLNLEPRVSQTVAFDLPQKTGESDWTIRASAGAFKTTVSAKIDSVEAPLTYATLTDRGVNFGVALRGGNAGASKAASGADVAIQNALTAKETVDVGGSGAMMMPLTAKCDGVSKRALGLQVPFKGVIGYVFVSYEGIKLPAGSSPFLRTSFGKRDGSNLGDGMLYRVLLTDANGQEHLLGETWVRKYGWIDFAKDLKPWAGQTIALKFICDAGENAEGDWGALAFPEIVDESTVLQHAIR